MTEKSKKEYYLEGLDCADCARKFGLDVAKLPGVEKAEVIFAANKLLVWGEPDFNEIVKLAKLEDVRVLDKSATKDEPKAKMVYKTYLPVWLGALTLLVGLLLPGNYGKAALLLTVIIGGGPTFIKAVKNLSRLKFDMSVLMSVAVVGALFINDWKEGALVAWLFALSHLLESYTAAKARNSLHGLMEKVPLQALVMRGNERVLLPVEDVKIGDKLLVQAGEKIPLDGVVAEGFSQVNQAAITGESVPVEKNMGDKVFGGSLNEMGALVVEVTHLAQESIMAKIVQMVEEAQNRQSQTQTFIERFAAVYTPIVMVLAVLVAVLPPLLFNVAWQQWIYNGLALLVVACPCALVITTPVVLVAAMSNGAKNGIIIKGGAELEALSKIKQVAFDKTGTLTYGKHRVQAIESFKPEMNENQILQLAAAVEINSAHPLAKSICEESETRKLNLDKATDFRMHNAAGVEAKINAQTIWVGKLTQALSAVQNAVWQKWQGLGNTIIAVEADNEVIGLIALGDVLREDAAHAVQELEDLGVQKVVMLSGDNATVAEAFARKIGIKEWHGGLLPEDKLAYIKQVQQNSPVMMVGDGINDAPALALADIGLAMGVMGSDTALEVADVALMADDVTKIPYALDLGKRAVKVIKQNIGFAIGLKLLVLVSIFPGWLSLWLAIIADMGANIIVTLNGMRLIGSKKETPTCSCEACHCGVEHSH